MYYMWKVHACLDPEPEDTLFYLHVAQVNSKCYSLCRNIISNSVIRIKYNKIVKEKEGTRSCKNYL